MSTERHARVKASFLAVLDLPESERAAYLEGLRNESAELHAEVLRMLEFDQATPGFLAEPLPARIPASAASVPERLGPFRVLRVIGSGGMGTVYEAEQERPHRRVALKVLDTGMLSPRFVRRFEFEGELLARLSHPGIAQVFETGTVDAAHGGTHYIAMELVAGSPLTRFARERSLGRRERIELLARVADAVEHAHRRGVIHRDLKPANILVDEDGQPKVLDFGIGRTIDAASEERPFATEAGQILGTLQYMSPEQAHGSGDSIDVRADVYALGVLLYELLSQTVPYVTSGKPLHAALHTVIMAEPVPLSARDRTLAGDLETIVAKALEKAPDRRYSSAGALADELRRFLAHEPILAQPATRMYRLKKFARRNRVLVAGASATFVALVLGLAGTSWQALVARDRANREREASETSREILQHLLLDGIAALDPRDLGPKVTAADVFARSEQRLDGAFQGRPVVEAAVRDALGTIWRALGAPERAEPLLVRALELRREHLGADDLRTLETMEHLGSCLLDRGRPAEALALSEVVLARRTQLLGERDPATLVALNDVAVALFSNGRTQEALEHIRSAVKLREEVLGPTHVDTLNAKNNLAIVLNVLGAPDEARVAFEEIVAARSATSGADHPDVLRARLSLAQCLERLGKLDDAEGTWRELLAGYERAYGVGHPLTTPPLQGLAAALAAQGKRDEAEPLYRKALALLETAYGAGHNDVVGARNELAQFLTRNGKVEEALELTRRSADVQRASLPAGLPNFVLTLNHLGQALRGARHPQEARAAFEEAIGLARGSKDVPVDSLSQCVLNLGVLLREELAQPAEAAVLLAEALELDRTIYPEGHQTLAVDLYHLGQALVESGRPAEAEPLLRKLLAPPYDLGPDHRRTPARVRALGSCLAALGRHDEAIGELERAVERSAAVFGAEDARTRGAREELARVRAAAPAR